MSVRTRLVVRARAGDRNALDDLARLSLPLVYTMVRRGLGADPAVDDVVQDIMLRMLRRLPELREPEHYRSWLMSIALRQIGTHLRRDATAADRPASLDDAAGTPHPAVFEDASLLRAELSRQRHQVMHAGRWLDAGNRALLQPWWLLTAGEVTRGEVAQALGITDAHAGVRLQRMRAQLELSRSIVVALEAVPGCPDLGGVVAGWDGVPSAFWRKRIGRHVRSCELCRSASAGLVATERLLAGLALLPVPAVVAAAVAAAVAGKGTAVVAPVAVSPFAGPIAKAGVAGRLLGASGLHPVAATVSAGALAAVVAVAVAGFTGVEDRTATAAAVATPAPLSGPQVTPSVTPTAAPPSLTPGRVSLESADATGQYLTVAGDVGVLGAGPDAATVELVPGLADPGCYSLRTPDGRILRHSSWLLRADRDDGTVLFGRDATFCVRAGAVAGSLSLESLNYPRFFIRHIGEEFRVDESDGSDQFRATSSWRVRPPRD